MLGLHMMSKRSIIIIIIHVSILMQDFANICAGPFYILTNICLNIFLSIYGLLKTEIKFRKAVVASTPPAASLMSDELE